MNTKVYDIPLIKQGLQECSQASAAALLQYYGSNKSIEDIKNEVPVYISKENKPLGSSIGHIATYLLQQGFKVMMHIVDVEIFDRTWNDKTTTELVDLLKQRRKYIAHHRYDNNAIDLIFDGYIAFLENGGKMIFPIIDESYIQNQLQDGPIYTIVNWNFLNSLAKGKFSYEKNDFERDAIAGTSSTHAVIIAGYKNGQFLIVDPDKDYGGNRWISTGHLLGSIYLAETDYDCLLITLSK